MEVAFLSQASLRYLPTEIGLTLSVDALCITAAYDALNRPQSIQDSTQSSPTTYGYDRAGRAAKMVSPNGQVTLNAYDVSGRLTRAATPPAHVGRINGNLMLSK
jgi:YD repeat-containing protein